MSPCDEEPGDGSCEYCGSRDPEPGICCLPPALDTYEGRTRLWAAYIRRMDEVGAPREPIETVLSNARSNAGHRAWLARLAKVHPQHDCPNCGAPIAGYGLLCLRCFRAPVGVRPREPKRSAKR